MVRAARKCFQSGVVDCPSRLKVWPSSWHLGALTYVCGCNHNRGFVQTASTGVVPIHQCTPACSSLQRRQCVLWVSLAVRLCVVVVHDSAVLFLHSCGDLEPGTRVCVLCSTCTTAGALPVDSVRHLQQTPPEMFALLRWHSVVQRPFSASTGRAKSRLPKAAAARLLPVRVQCGNHGLWCCCPCSGCPCHTLRVHSRSGPALRVLQEFVSCQVWWQGRCLDWLLLRGALCRCPWVGLCLVAALCRRACLFQAAWGCMQCTQLSTCCVCPTGEHLLHTASSALFFQATCITRIPRMIPAACVQPVSICFVRLAYSSHLQHADP
jgi:hypothetical protein